VPASAEPLPEPDACVLPEPDPCALPVPVSVGAPLDEPPPPAELEVLGELPVLLLLSLAWPGELPHALSTMADTAIRAVAATTRVLLIDCPPWGAPAVPEGVPVDPSAECGQPCAR